MIIDYQGGLSDFLPQKQFSAAEATESITSVKDSIIAVGAPVFRLRPCVEFSAAEATEFITSVSTSVRD